jgi:hypothetical protein
MEITSMVLVLDLMVVVTGHIDFASDDRLYLRKLFGHLQEFLDSIHVSMIGYGKSRHAKLPGTFKKASYGSLTVKYGILCMDVKMDK